MILCSLVQVTLKKDLPVTLEDSLPPSLFPGHPLSLPVLLCPVSALMALLLSASTPSQVLIPPFPQISLPYTGSVAWCDFSGGTLTWA